MALKKILTAVAVVAGLAIAVIQFIPAPPLVVPAQLPAEQRAAHRLLNFEGIANFRDLGGYRTEDGRTLKWGKLYRAGNFSEASKADLVGLQSLGLSEFIDFRSSAEKAAEPNQLPNPPGFNQLEIPVFDTGNEALVGDIAERLESGSFEDFDPAGVMIQANRQFADEFTPQFRQFIHTVLDAGGAPVLWHCTAGKDRTGYASAILLRILGVPQEVIMQDYMASREPALAAHQKDMVLLRLFKGEEAADKVSVLLGVEKSWLQAGFDEIDTTWGDFDNYVRGGLELSAADIQRLRTNLLE